METQDTIKIKKWKLGMKTNEEENEIESFKKYKEVKNQEKIHSQNSCLWLPK